MSEKILISISADQATVSHWRDGKLAPCQIFENDESGWQGFEAFLKVTRGIPAYMMVDAVEEDYRFEILPHTQGRDRNEIVGRKLRQLYRNTPYCTAWMQGRDSGKRRDDVFLFAALTNPDMLFGWVQALGKQQTPLVGIYTLPVVSISLAERLKLKAQNLLIVSQHASGLRQTVLREGKLRLSRLTRLETSNEESRAAAYAEEIQNTRLYLHALKVMTLDDHMVVAVLDRDDALNDLSTLIQQRFVNSQVEHLSRADIVSRLGVPSEVLDFARDTIYLHVLGQTTPGCNFAPATLITHYRRFQARRFTYGVSAVAFLAVAGWAGANVWQRSDLTYDVERLRTATSFEQQKYEAVTRQFPNAPTSAANLKQAVEIAEKVRIDARTPEQMLVALSRALEDSPTIFLRSLNWKFSRPEGRDAPTPSSAGQADDRRQHAIIDAEIRPFKGDYRSAIATIDRFVERIAAQKNVADVRVLQLPINVSQTSVLSGNTATEAQVQAYTAQFKLGIVLKPSI